MPENAGVLHASVLVPPSETACAFCIVLVFYWNNTGSRLQSVCLI